jgi:hypothetical protein
LTAFLGWVMNWKPTCRSEAYYSVPFPFHSCFFLALPIHYPIYCPIHCLIACPVHCALQSHICQRREGTLHNQRFDV